MSEPCQNTTCKMEAEIRAIHQAIVGDPTHGHRGLVSRVEFLEGDVKSLKRSKAWVSGWVAGLSFAFFMMWEWVKSKLNL